ncbi:MAG: hypothetical protein ACOCU8_02490 [Patescibacteria group bacterium]
MMVALGQPGQYTEFAPELLEEGRDFVVLRTEDSSVKVFREVEDYFGPDSRLSNGLYDLKTKGATTSPCFNGGPAMYYEHIFNGAAVDNWRSEYAPELNDQIFTDLTNNSVKVVWPRATSLWNLRSSITYELGDDGVDFTFEVKTPATEAEVAEIAPLGWFGCMFASYTRSIHSSDRSFQFYGVESQVMDFRWFQVSIPNFGWKKFGDSKERGTIGPYRVDPLPYEEEAGGINAHQREDLHSLSPMYFSVVQPNEGSPPMIFAMLFDQTQSVRFALFGGDELGGPTAYDWHFIVRQPQPDTKYRLRAKLIYEPLPEEGMSERKLRSYIQQKWFWWWWFLHH